MFQGQANDESHTPRLQTEFKGSGPGGGCRTAIGLSEDGNIDPSILVEDPPFWFPLIAWKFRKHFLSGLAGMPSERALSVLAVSGMPPLCILSLGLRWGLIDRAEFDYLDLQVLFAEAGILVPDFGRFLDVLEARSVYHLYSTLGFMELAILTDADVSMLAQKRVLPPRCPHWSNESGSEEVHN